MLGIQGRQVQIHWSISFSAGKLLYNRLFEKQVVQYRIYWVHKWEKWIISKLSSRILVMLKWKFDVRAFQFITMIEIPQRGQDCTDSLITNSFYKLKKRMNIYFYFITKILSAKYFSKSMRNTGNELAEYLIRVQEFKSV